MSEETIIKSQDITSAEKLTAEAPKAPVALEVHRKVKIELAEGDVFKAEINGKAFVEFTAPSVMNGNVSIQLVEK